jgi:hypothetical protein
LFEVCSVKFNMGVCFSLLGFVNLNSKLAWVSEIKISTNRIIS